MSNSNYSPCATIVRWEETGASLLTAFDHYADLCSSLGIDSLNEGANPKDLASRIESALETVHATISNQLAKIVDILSRTCNKLASPMLSLPEEVLLQIFENVIFDYHRPEAPYHLRMEDSVKRIYKSLSVLCRVCSTWRDMVVARGALWSVIAIINYPKVDSSLSLERARGNSLHLAVRLTYGTEEEFYRILHQHGTRFRTINLCLDNHSSGLIGEILTGILPYGAVGSLSELSVAYSNWSRSANTNDEYVIPNPELKADNYIFSRNSPHINSFNNLLRLLTAFRIRRINLHWDVLAFSSRLVELRIEEVKLGYDAAITPLLQALSSASELRDLKVIAVITFHKPDSTPGEEASGTFTFPKLQSLLLENLYLNTLKHLISTITPGPHHLTLSLNHRSTKFNVYRPGGNMWAHEHEDADEVSVDILEQWLALGPIKVGTLRILGQGRRMTSWLKWAMLRPHLSAMPTLKTLQIHHWTFEKDNWDRSTSDLSQSLENLYLTRVKIRDEERFQEMVTSHPLQRIVIGGSVLIPLPDEGGPTYFRNLELQEDSDLVRWLRDIVPNVRLVDSGYCPREFSRSEWQLW